MRFGLNASPQHNSPEEWAAILAKKGYRAASFPANYQTPISVIDAYVKAAKENDITIAEVGVWNNPHHPDPKEAALAREVCLEQFRLAEYIKAQCCVNVSGAAGEDWAFCYADNFTQKLYDENVRFVQDLCDKVRPRYSCYTLEPMPWMLPDSPEQYLQFIKDVNRTGTGVHMDAINWVKDPCIYTHKEDMIDRAFDLLGDYIKSCHIKDCRMDQGYTVAIREVPIGEGTFALAHYMKRIRQLSRDIPVLIEHLKDMEAYDKALAVCQTIYKEEVEK